MSTYLLAIGINHYTDRAFRALSCCENDASEIHALFKRNLELGDRASKLVGAVSIADVKNELRRIGQEIRNGDTFVLFFAGHGYQHPKREDQFLLFPEAEARLVNKGYLDGMLSLSALCELTEHWAGVARVFILDACRSWLPGRDASGARFDNEAALAYIASRDPAFGPDNAKPTDSLNAPAGALPPVILNATRNGQEAKELEDRQRGVLALALEQALESQHKSGEVIWLGEQMLTDVNQRMNTLLQHGRLGVEQTPFLTPPSARVLLFKPQRIAETPTNDDDETEWAITCAKQSIEAYASYARRTKPGKYHNEALQRISEIASNEGSMEQQEKRKRDEMRRKEALANDNLFGWQKALMEAETEEFRSEARGKIAWFEQETTKSERETKVGLPEKQGSKLSWIAGAVVLSVTAIAFLASDKLAPRPLERQVSNSPDIAMIRIPAGSFIMGSSSDQESHTSSEGPQRRVQIPSFEIGKYEITQAQWKAVMGENSNPSRFKLCGDDCPVENVSWYNVQIFINKLNETTGLSYRLPSEAEWEYAARAGTTGPFSFEEPITPEIVNYDPSFERRSDTKGVFRNKTVKVGSLPENPWGLHETHGNVMEWVQDCYHNNYKSAPRDEQPWETTCTANERVARGGAWNYPAENSRSTARFSAPPEEGTANTGFRIARSL